MWVGPVNAGGSVDLKVGGVDIVSGGSVMWVNDTGTGDSVDTRVGGVLLGGKAELKVYIVDFGDGMT